MSSRVTVSVVAARDTVRVRVEDFVSLWVPERVVVVVCAVVAGVRDDTEGVVRGTTLLVVRETTLLVVRGATLFVRGAVVLRPRTFVVVCVAEPPERELVAEFVFVVI